MSPHVSPPRANPCLCIKPLRAIFTALLTFLIVTSFLMPSARADVPRAYAGIVIDAKTGNTLYSYAADSARYPASVTKVMTLYVLFQELEAGRLSLSTRMKVSRYASQAVPTKLHLRAGRTIKVEDAIKALVTLSANDVARVIAEHISGSEAEFARRMTRTARALGMSRTTYANASGLPNSRQVTTVRDQARLGMAVFQHFPKYYEYFQTRRFTYGGRTYGNHNKLLGEGGVDGIKTGYIRASGFNLLTAARRNNRHIVVVGFGFNSGAARNAKVRELISRYMNRGRRGSYWQQASIPKVGPQGNSNSFAVAQNTPVTPAPRPANRQLIVSDTPQPGAVMVASQAPVNQPVPTIPPVLPAPRITTRTDQASPVTLTVTTPPTQLIPATAIQATALIVPTRRTAPQPLDVIGAWLTENFTLGSSATGSLQNSGVATLRPPANIGEPNNQADNQTIDLMTSGSIDPPAPTTTPQVTPQIAPVWVVQIGAPPTQQAAQSMLQSATQRITALGNFRPYVEEFNKTGQTFFRARFTGFAERAHAISMCEEIKQNNMSCLAVQS
ncbi:MAG: serine hydrolase [Devosiaceae bacterium]|nr:serine hydrolase [Devosiaceae bacterium]